LREDYIMNVNQKSFYDACVEKFGATATKTQITEFAEERGEKFPHFLLKSDYRIKRGMYSLDAVVTPIATARTPVTPTKPVTLSAETTGFTENLIPEKDELFVSFGNFNMVRDVIKSKMFYPLYITGLSGNGKTFGVEQACAATKREVIRVNFTVETDEDDLIGGFRLVDGETKFFHGPAIKAMQRGAVLLLDEIDLANPAKVMCLQSILEGKGYFIKKTGEFIKPTDGFTVVATANTKGKGSEDGRFIGTNVMNEAFLERFPITVEQDYPTPAIEKKILGKVFDDLGLNDGEFVEKLVDWADIIRKTFMDGGVDEIISTRRLVHIAKAHAIFNDRMRSIEMCTNRFDDDTKLSFMDLYTKVDAGVVLETEDDRAEQPEYSADQMPF
jgi:MoxR-like ATPase